MSRLFGRGELKVALLHVAAELGPTNGYSIMQALADRIGGSWHPSPGAIYPALLALEDAGLLLGHDEDGGRRYELTRAGRTAAAARPDVLAEVAGRARRAPAPPDHPGRRARRPRGHRAGPVPTCSTRPGGPHRIAVPTAAHRAA